MTYILLIILNKVYFGNFCLGKIINYLSTFYTHGNNKALRKLHFCVY